LGLQEKGLKSKRNVEVKMNLLVNWRRVHLCEGGRKRMGEKKVNEKTKNLVGLNEW